MPCECEQILPKMRRMGRYVQRPGLGIPPDNMEPLKRMLSVGLLVYLKVPLPECVTEDALDMSQILNWSADVSQDKHRKKVRSELS